MFLERSRRSCSRLWPYLVARYPGIGRLYCGWCPANRIHCGLYCVGQDQLEQNYRNSSLNVRCVRQYGDCDVVTEPRHKSAKAERACLIQPENKYIGVFSICN